MNGPPAGTAHGGGASALGVGPPLVAGADDVPATDPEYLASPELLAVGLGRVLARLHALRPAPGAPELRPRHVVEAAARRLADGLLVPEAVPAAYRHVPPDRLVALLEDGAGRAEAAWAPVPTHGAPTLAHLRCADGAVVGFVGWDGAALADRHRDLAVAAGSVAETLRPVLVPVLVDAYVSAGPVHAPPDVLLLDWCALAAALVPPGASPPSPPPPPDPST